MEYEELAEKINNSRFAGHVRQSQHKVEVFDEKNILREVSSGTMVAKRGLPTQSVADRQDQILANGYYNSYFGADPTEVAEIIEELEKRKPELVHRVVWDSSQTIEVNEFYKDKNRIVEIKKGYVIDKGVRYEGYGHPKEYSLEDGMELVQYRKEITSNKGLAKRIFSAEATIISTMAISVYPAAIVPALAGWGYVLHEIKKENEEEKRMEAIKKRAKVIHSPI